MKQSLIRIHKGKKEAATSANRENMLQYQLAREETWNDARRATEAANKALRERITKARRRQPRKETINERQTETNELVRKEAEEDEEARIATKENT